MLTYLITRLYSLANDEVDGNNTKLNVCRASSDYYIDLNLILGIILVISIQPGVGSSASETKKPAQNVSTIDTLMDLIRNMFPPNLVQACIAQTRTELKPPENASNGNHFFSDTILLIVNNIST